MRNIWKNTYLFAFSLLFQGVNFFLFLWLHDTDLLSSLFHAAERLLILFQKVCCCSLRCFKITATLWDHLIRRKKFRTVPNESVFNKRIKDCTRLRVLSLTLNMWHENISFAWHLLFIIIYVCVYLTRKIPHFWEFLIELLLSQLSGFRNVRVRVHASHEAPPMTHSLDTTPLTAPPVYIVSSPSQSPGFKF